MGYLIGVVLLLWLMSKATKKGKKVMPANGRLGYVTCDEMDEALCSIDELEEIVKEMRG